MESQPNIRNLGVNSLEMRGLIRKGLAPDPAQISSKELKAVSQFEEMFVSMMLKEMRKTVSKSGLLSGGTAEEIYTDFYDQAVAEEAGKSGPLGMRDVLMRELIKDRGIVPPGQLDRK